MMSLTEDSATERGASENSLSPYPGKSSQLETRQELIQQIASEQRGCQPYVNRRWICIPQRCAGMSLLEALQIIHPGYTAFQWLFAIDSGEIHRDQTGDKRLRNRIVNATDLVSEGERFLHAMPDYVEPAINPQIELIHEDEAIAVINKSAPLPLHPSGRYKLNTLASILGEAFSPEKLRLVHRLDSNTTGLVVLAKTPFATSQLQTQFAQRRVEKVYLAHVDGVPTWEEVECSMPIEKEPLPNGGRCIHLNGRSALTRFKVLRRNIETSLIAAYPMTGRTHQIRLHLASLNFPLVNEPLYLPGGTSREVADPNRSLTALGLHAWQLTFNHPVTAQPITFRADRVNGQIQFSQLQLLGNLRLND